MLCSSIKLADRKEIKQNNAPARRNKSTMLKQKLFMTSDYYHSYTFRSDKPKKFYNCESVQYLTINNIILPENIEMFNTGSSTEKWSKKRPRLKSTQQRRQSPISSNFDDTAEEAEKLSHEGDDVDGTAEVRVSETSIAKDDSENEIDPDIKKLLSIVEESHSNESESHNSKRQCKKHRHKRKEKHASDDSSKEKVKKKTKTVKIALSKPPSPQTNQVIRVDVTSNYSLEETEAVETNRTDTNVSDYSKGCGKRIRSTVDVKIVLNNAQANASVENKSPEIKLQCNKVVLRNRKVTVM